MEQLTMYLQKFSQYAYINCTSGAPPDLTFVDSLLGLDFLEGALEVEHPPSDASYRRTKRAGSHFATTSTSTSSSVTGSPPTPSNFTATPPTLQISDLFEVDQTPGDPPHPYLHHPHPQLAMSSPLVSATATFPPAILERAELETEAVRSLSSPLLASHHALDSPLSSTPNTPSPTSQRGPGTATVLEID
jgi:hypothetical protein